MGRDGGDRRSAAEWVSLGVGLLLVGALAGALLYLHLTRAGTPATIDVRLLTEEARPHDGRFYLPLELRNGGDRAAEEVRVRVEHAGAAPIEAELGRLAGRATARLVVVLDQDPRAAPPAAAVISFVEP